MSGVFSLVGGAADPIAIKLTTTGATKIAEAVEGGARVSIPWIKFTEIAGATPTLGYYILKPNGDVVYHRNAKAMTAKEEVVNELGIVLLPGWGLYAIAGTANQVDVTGLALLGDGNA
jgi:hypothetical protein